jgi:hypothetical protein
VQGPREIHVAVGTVVAALPQVQGVGFAGAVRPAGVDVGDRGEEVRDRLSKKEKQEMEKLTRKRPQRGPQPPPTYTSLGNVPDGYITWNSSRPELSLATDRARTDCYVYVKQQGTVMLDKRRKGTTSHRLN